MAIVIYLFAPGASNHAPDFACGIYFSLFAFFNRFAIVQYLQSKRVGRFANYLVGERLYITLSFVAKSLLAGQIFAATLASAGQKWSRCRWCQPRWKFPGPKSVPAA